MPPIPYKSHLKSYARKLRSEMTPQEHILWSHLRKKQMCGMQFYRQKPIGNYIVDFYCPKAKLIIEIDGSHHFDAREQLEDRERDRLLKSKELLVLRFDNRQINLELDAVLERIYDICAREISS